MNLDRLRTFRALAESLHFRKTADKLHVSQSAVSQQISAGLGVAFVSRHVAAADLAAKRLVPLRVEGLRLQRPITAAYHRDKRVTPVMKEMIGLLKRHAPACRSFARETCCASRCSVRAGRALLTAAATARAGQASQRASTRIQDAASDVVRAPASHEGSGNP